MKLPKPKRPFDPEKLRALAKQMSESKERDLAERYPNIRPPEEFEWNYDWQNAGIEEKINILYQAVNQIYEYLNKKAK